MQDKMGNQVSRRRAIAIAGSALLAAPAFVRAQGAPIKIGQITTASGRSAVLGIATKRGIQLELDAFNEAGGLGGRMLQLVERDSKGAPDAAASLTRELIGSEGCQIVLDCDSSAAAFAIHEVFRGSPQTLGIHCVSETSQLSADPKIQAPNVFRIARQGIHDSITGGKYAAEFCKKNKLKRWATVSADYSYGRQTTPEFLGYVASNGAEVNLVAQTWPKLGQPDYTENITAILRAKPEVIFCSLFGGDLTAFLDQAAIYGLFANTVVFANFIADYTTLTVLKSAPPNIYGPNRYLSTYPATQANRDWFAAYQKKFNDHPTNWTWQSATAVRAIVKAMKTANSADAGALMKAMRGMEIDTPLGVRNGKANIRRSDQTLIDYALGWGKATPKAPYLTDIVSADWDTVLAQEEIWKKSKGY
jgi:branched-chain amino acid transport system substrate-binding protein